MHLLRIGFVATLGALLGGCILVPFADAFSRTGATEGDRTRLLNERVGEFHQALYWGDSQRALALVEPEARERVQAVLRQGGRDERTVESRIDRVDFSEESRRAIVDVLVKSYRVPVYVVQERIDRQEWAFTLVSGWQVTAYERAVADPEASGRELR